MVAASLDIFGGQSVQANALLQRLRKDGYRVSLIPINPDFPRPLRLLRKVRYLRTIMNEIMYLPSLLRLRKADVVHIYSASYFSFLLGPVPALLMARLMRKRVILNYHSGEAEDHLRHWGVLVHPWIRLAHEVVVPSEFLREVFAGYGYSVRVVPNIADTSGFLFNERHVIEPRLLSTRNLEPHYRVDMVIRAFALIRQHYHRATLVVAGNGSEIENLRRLAKDLGLRDIEFLGAFSPADAPQLYAGADIFINASVVDNQPVSVLEAFATGVAVVSTDTGDIGTMLDGGLLGMLVPAEAPQAIADAVSTLMENPEERAEMTRQACRSLERYGWARIRAIWSAAYSGRSIDNKMNRLRY
jgi:glycosyltransferase involved in cell wall biosynthesis